MEVPARFMRDVFRAAEECGVSRDELTAGLPPRLAALDGSGGGRLPWNDCAAIVNRLGAVLGTDERVEEAGRVVVAVSSEWAFTRLVPHLIAPARILRLAFGFAGPALFPHIRHRIEDRPGGTIRLTLSLPAAYDGCEPYFRMCVGGVRSLPTLFGHEPALVVVAAIGPHALTLEITPPPSRTIVGRVRRALDALRGESVLFEEVSRQHEAVQRLFGELLRTQREVHEFMERIPDTIVVHHDGVIVWCNRALLAALKCESLDDVRGKRIIDFVHPAEHDAALRRISTPMSAALPGTYRVRAMDGSYRTLEVSQPQNVVFEGSAARVSVGRDVTERDALREQLVLADRMTQLGFLAAGVAHEINNPLAYAMAALDRAEGDLRAGRGGAAADALAIAREGAERVRAITRDLSVFSRGGEQRLEAVDVSAVLRATLDLAGANVRTRGHLERELAPLPFVLGDRARIGQVFMNLLVNALDALAEGDPETSRIRVRAFTDPAGLAVIEVEDNGSGIAADVLPRIFDPFFTTKGPRSGSGLGLAICQRIVSDLGGRIEVRSPLGEGGRSGPAGGALFRVSFPPHAPPRAELVRPAGPSRRLRVLVVDDEPALARALQLMLEDDHEIELASDGEEAIRRLDAGAEYDVILCDLMMAGLGGIDLYERLEARASRVARRIVFMTGGAFSPRAQRFLGEVKNPCLEKPFTREGVLAALDAASAVD